MRAEGELSAVRAVPRGVHPRRPVVLSSPRLLRLGIGFAEGLDGDALHDLVLQRTIAEVRCSLSDGVHHVHALDDLTESSVLPVKMRARLMHYKELAACGVRHHGTRHGKNARRML